MQHLKYIDLYEDGVIQRRVRCDKMPRTEQTKLRRQLYKELETASQRNRKKTFWIELKNE